MPPLIRPLRAIRALPALVLIAWCAASAAPGGMAAAAQASAASDRDVIATVDGKRLTEAEFVAQDQEAFDKQQNEFETRRHKLQLAIEQARYDLLEQKLQRFLDQRALELEAGSRGITTDAVLAELQVPAVTEQEQRELYESRKAETTASFEQVQVEITQFLADEHKVEATRRFYDALRARHGIVELLSPYRLPVAATGPALGKPDAPVTIVEFADFQCPFCRAAEATLHTVMARHPDDIRLVFRHLPLANVHPNALIAAEAGVCADHQGKFWTMHDAMFADQSALGGVGLKATAQRLGLDADAFASCLTDPATKAAVVADARAADALNISGTPYFLINGRPLNGALPAGRFESLITDELQRQRGTGHLAAAAR
jgi:protein-disulfide isomerase